MTVLLANNAVSKLAGSIDNIQTTLAVTAGQGPRFPDPAAGEWFPATISKLSGGSVLREIVHCTSRSGDTLTIIRAQEGTTPLEFASGDRIGLRYTKEVFETVVQRTSTTGSAVIPSGTNAQRDGSPVAGYIRFNSQIGLFEGYDGTSWIPVGSGATGAMGDQVFVENDQAVTTDYSIPANKNASSTGPVTINDGITVTVPDGSRWVIL